MGQAAEQASYPASSSVSADTIFVGKSRKGLSTYTYLDIQLVKYVDR